MHGQSIARRLGASRESIAMSKDANRPTDSGMPSENIRELTASELGAVAGAAILQVNGGGNIPSATGTSPGGMNVVMCDGSVRFIA